MAGSGALAPVCYVCKYTPIELFAGFGRQVRPLDNMPANLEGAESMAHANLCGFGKSVLQAATSGQVDELVLVNCCDVMRRVHDILQDAGCCRFLHLMDLPHAHTSCSREALARSIRRLRDAYAAYSGAEFDLQACRSAFARRPRPQGAYAAVLGVRAGKQLEEAIARALPLPVRNLTCTGLRDVALPDGGNAGDSDGDGDAFFAAYAQALLGQVPCQRMADTTARRALFQDPNLQAAVYHTIKFCDFYGSEYAQVKDLVNVPLLKLESDFTQQSAGQLATRVQAFAEALAPATGKEARMELHAGEYVAGIDSGSTSTDVVIMDGGRNIVASAIIPTGAGARQSAERSLAQALERAGIPARAVVRTVTTGYGRDFLDMNGESVTEISCHAKGAHFLDPRVRTIIDIGGQDSKAIRIDETGAVRNFAMNDKCAAGTGRFLDMMARTLGLSLDELGTVGLSWHENIPISSMCTVFAESEVVTLVAQNKRVADIVHGLNTSVAAKVAGLVRRVGGQGAYMMTGGVARNPGVVAALEDRLDAKLLVPPEAQLCGAIGAALFALGA